MTALGDPKLPEFLIRDQETLAESEATTRHDNTASITVAWAAAAVVLALALVLAFYPECKCDGPPSKVTIIRGASR